HRLVSDGVNASDAWTQLRLPVNAACRHGYFYSALSSLRKVLPHFPAARADRRAVLQGTRRADGAGNVPALRPALCFAHAYPGSEGCAAVVGNSLRTD